MHFSVTHPLITHPYHPDLVTGSCVMAMAKAAEDAGFDGYGFTDHPAPSQKWLSGGGHDALDPFVGLAFVAAATTTLRLVPNIVVLPYRNPFVVAKAGASLDVMSGGRFTLATGAGYLRSEFSALGVDVDERNDLFDEAIDVLKAVWTGDDVTFEGRHFHARGVTAHPRPVSQPHPPIWIGGNSAGARRRAAERGDGWCPFPAPAGLATSAKTTALDSTERLGRRDRRSARPGSMPRAATRRRSTSRFAQPRRRQPGRRRLRRRRPPGRAGELDRWASPGSRSACPGDSPPTPPRSIARYGELVIAPHRTGVGAG